VSKRTGVDALPSALARCRVLRILFDMPTNRIVHVVATASLAAFASAHGATPAARPRASDLGLKVGILPTGPLDAITDVAGVKVGQTTIIRGDNIRTGVTAILPHAGNLYRERVPGAIFVGNGFGKLAGSTQVEEMGDIETPIVLTSTTSVPRVADAVISYMLTLPGNEDVLSINPVVGETNDGYLSDIRGRHIAPGDVFAAIKSAKGGAVDEGAVGAGTGTVAFGWKGGIGTASRHLPANVGGYTVGVLVQTNFGGVLTARNLKRLAARAMLGLARTGSSASNGSGDYAIAFSTAQEVRIQMNDKAPTRKLEVLTNDAISPLFLAVIEATEEAIYNSMFKATTMTANGHTAEALPIDKTIDLLKTHKVIR
jgi:D-aminopeptidase